MSLLAHDLRRYADLLEDVSMHRNDLRIVDHYCREAIGTIQHARDQFATVIPAIETVQQFRANYCPVVIETADLMTLQKFPR